MVGIFPNRAALIRLAGPCWPSSTTSGSFRRYMGTESQAKARMHLIVGDLSKPGGDHYRIRSSDLIINHG